MINPNVFMIFYPEEFYWPGLKRVSATTLPVLESDRRGMRGDVVVTGEVSRSLCVRVRVESLKNEPGYNNVIKIPNEEGKVV